MPRRDPIHWKIQGSTDGETWVDLFEQKNDQPLWTDRDQVILFEAGVDYPPQTEPYTWYRYLALATTSSHQEGGEHALGEIELFVEHVERAEPTQPQPVNNNAGPSRHKP